MAEYKRPTTIQEFQKNFAQKNPLMSETEAYYESSRCLFCYDAPCIQACPTAIDIPLFIKQIHTDNIIGAARTIFESNWMGNVCGKVCPTSELCEGACVHDNQDVPVIQIGRLQNYATDQMIKENQNLFSPGSDNGRKVAIIGAGPAGISCACELRMMGYEVDIYEAREKPSGLALHGTAPYKITNEEVIDEINYLQEQLGFQIQYNSKISGKDSIEALEHKYEAIFLGVGIGSTAGLNIPGLNKKNVVGAVEFIEELKLKHHNITIPDRVIVIGGGNTAMDAASESCRLGAEDVTLVYRRSKIEMGAYDFEYKFAFGSGMRSYFNLSPIEILGDEKVEGVKFIKTRIVNNKLEYIDDEKIDLACDLVILATGQEKQVSFLSKIEGIDLDSKNRIAVNENLQTTNPKYFAGGDAVNGGAEVVNAAYEGKIAARGIDKWLNNKT